MHFKRFSLAACIAGMFMVMVFGPVGTGAAAPIVVTPGEASSYVYFPAGVTAQGGGGDTSEFIGMIAAFPVTPPNGWLECDGRTIQAADYPSLVKLLTGDPASTSAQLPDYRGYFLRGWDSMGTRGAAEVDAGRALGGTPQDDMIEAHSHTGTTSTNGAHSHTVTLFHGAQKTGPHQVSLRDGVPPYTTGNWLTSTAGDHSHTFTTADTGGVETRPKNISVIYAIRAK